MKAEEFCRLRKQYSLPYADQKVILEGCFSSSIESVRRNPDTYFDDEKAKKVLNKIQQGYPANYLAGYRDVQHLHLFLNEDTLIPRNETIWFVFDYLKNHYSFNHKKVLDIGTGSGLIALGIKKLFPEADVTASDICESALKEAERSAQYNKLEVRFIKSDFFNSITGCFDFIVSNPPYIEEGSKEVDAKYEPPLALYSGKDGCDSYKSLFSSLDFHLNKKGVSFFELEATNVERVLKIADSLLPSYTKEVLKDQYERPRYLIRKKN